jgi:glutathione S-transferase/GST-like protein
VFELYHWEPTLNSAEPLICLKERGAEFKSHYVDLLRFEQHTREFLHLNPQGQVPVLIDEDRVITETSLMIQYIDAKVGGAPLAAETCADRYRMHVWSKMADDYFAPALAVLGWHMRMAGRLTTDVREMAAAGLNRLPVERQAIWRTALADSYSPEQLDTARRSLSIMASRLEEGLRGSDWLAGPRYSLAEIAVFPMARALSKLLPELINDWGTPRVVNWLARVAERPAVREVSRFARTNDPDAQFAPGPETSRWG